MNKTLIFTPHHTDQNKVRKRPGNHTLLSASGVFLGTDDKARPHAHKESASQSTFARTEKKYLLPAQKFHDLWEGLQAHMRRDVFGETTINSLYLDTPTFYLIRQSIEKPIYKEKFRIRGYGSISSADLSVFLEAKKKFKGIVYKRRVEMSLHEAMDYVECGTRPYSLKRLEPDKRFVAEQMMREFEWARTYYKKLQPAMLISCNRSSFVGIDEPDLRITFDTSVLWRDYELRLNTPRDGYYLIDPDCALMEVKCPRAMPLWLASLLDDVDAFPQSFSKYGTAYTSLSKKLKETNTRA